MTAERRNPTAHGDETFCKAYVNESGQSTLVCPKCSVLKVISAEQFRQRQHQLKVRCSCSHVFSVNLDFRKCYRKPTNIEGIYNMTLPAVGGGKAKILNISLNGACFEVSGIHKIQIGQTGWVDFTLDDRKATHLKRDFIIRAVVGNAIGCEFKKSQAFEKELGFYLRFGP